MPAPRVKILDLYGNVVVGAFASGVSIQANQLNKTKSTLYGGIQSFCNASDGIATFDSLGLLGAPRSGPHILWFNASIEVWRGSSLSLLRAVDSTSARFIEARVRDCPEDTYFYEEKCHSCPDRSEVVTSGLRNGPAGQACKCEEGYHNSLSDGINMNCVPCPKGKTSNGTACVFCEPGKYKRGGAVLHVNCVLWAVSTINQAPRQSPSAFRVTKAKR